jgi:hypothetical protein
VLDVNLNRFFREKEFLGYVAVAIASRQLAQNLDFPAR